VARSNDRGSRRAPKDLGRRGKKKVCVFCRDKAEWVDYKDVNLLRKFMSDRGKIRARRVSGNCAQHQREVAVAIKTARELALLPYTQRTMSERGGARIGGRTITGLPRPPVAPPVEASAGSGEADGAGAVAEGVPAAGALDADATAAAPSNDEGPPDEAVAEGAAAEATGAPEAEGAAGAETGGTGT
jgi:small subunit ribosomal protein S18